jgi:Protein of unknown function (DUF2480)
MENEIVNKVANSGLITIDLEEYYPKGERVLFDIKPLLFHELILKEKDFREFIKQHDWSVYAQKLIAITCSADAVVPTWAYMLLSLALQPYAHKIVFGSIETLDAILLEGVLKQIDYSTYKDQRIVIKGCGNLPIPLHAYVALTANLKPFAKSIMFGEPCSTVPLYKSSVTK